MVDEKAFVNGVVALLATGGSTNHTMHLVAIAAAAGIQLSWDDFAELSAVVPLLARVYPNGSADINHFHAAGGIQFLVGTLLDAGLLHEDVHTVAGSGARPLPPGAVPGGRRAGVAGRARRVLRPGRAAAGVATRSRADGGLRMLAGNLGRAVIKVSAVPREHRVVQAPARVFTTQEAFKAAFEAGELDRDVVVVVRGQGPQANGMPELHKLTPALGVLMDRGHRVALVTDGRMSGASGKIPAAIQLTPEAAARRPARPLADGDVDPARRPVARSTCSSADGTRPARPGGRAAVRGSLDRHRARAVRPAAPRRRPRRPGRERVRPASRRSTSVP